MFNQVLPLNETKFQQLDYLLLFNYVTTVKLYYLDPFLVVTEDCSHCLFAWMSETSSYVVVDTKISTISRIFLFWTQTGRSSKLTVKGP